MSEKSLDKALDIKVKGNELYKKNEFEEALKLYTEAIEACPPHRQVELSVIFQNRAATNEKLERLEEGLKDCDESIKLNSRYGKALDRRSKLLKKVSASLGKTDAEVEKRIANLRQSMEDVSMVAQLDGYKQEQLIFVDEVLKDLGSSLAVMEAKKRPPVLPSSHTIIQYFTSFMDDPLFDPIEEDCPLAKARQAYDSKNFSEIVPLCEQEISANSKYSTRAKLVKGTFLVLMKQLEPALEVLSQVIDESSEDIRVKVNALVKRGALYIQRCHDPSVDCDLSFKDFDNAVELAPESADVLLNRGQINLLLDNFEKATEDLGKAAKLRPDFALANVQKLYTDFLAAKSAADTTKVAAVVSDFQAAIDKYSDCVEAYALYAKVLQEQNDLDGAEAMFMKGISLNPENANLVVHQAMLALSRTGDVKAAVEGIEAAIKIDDKCEFAYETLGQIEIQRGKMEEAIAAFDKAIPIVNTEIEMAQLFGLRESARAKVNAENKIKELPTGMQDMGLD